jgi:hypothetical protein
MRGERSSVQSARSGDRIAAVPAYSRSGARRGRRGLPCAIRAESCAGSIPAASIVPANRKIQSSREGASSPGSRPLRPRGLWRTPPWRARGRAVPVAVDPERRREVAVTERLRSCLHAGDAAQLGREVCLARCMFRPERTPCPTRPACSSIRYHQRCTVLEAQAFFGCELANHSPITCHPRDLEPLR